MAGFFDKQKIEKIYYIATSLMMLGIVLLVNPDKLSFDMYGVILSLGSALTYAAYIIASKKQTAKLDAITSAFAVSAGSCLAFLALSFLGVNFKIPNNMDLWRDVLSIGIICTALPILFLLKALEYISSEKASILAVLEPIGVVVAGVVLLHEHLSFMQVLGIIITLGGAIAVQLDKGKG